MTDLAQAAVATDLDLVIDLHTATEPTRAENAALAIRQTEDVLAHLVGAGFPADRVRIFGSGALRQFDGDDRSSRVVVTALPRR